jgi:hypothetical protein
MRNTLSIAALILSTGLVVGCDSSGPSGSTSMKSQLEEIKNNPAAPPKKAGVKKASESPAPQPTGTSGQPGNQ